MDTYITERFIDYYFSATLKRPLVPHVLASNNDDKIVPITDICLYFIGKESCPEGFTPTEYIFKRTFVGAPCRIGIKRDPDTPPLVDVKLLRSGTSLPTRMKEYVVLKYSRQNKISTQIRIGGRFTGTYAYIAVKRQKLQRGSLLHRESPIEDIRVAYKDDENGVRIIHNSRSEHKHTHSNTYRYHIISMLWRVRARSVCRKLTVGYMSREVWLTDF